MYWQHGENNHFPATYSYLGHFWLMTTKWPGVLLLSLAQNLADIEDSSIPSWLT